MDGLTPGRLPISTLLNRHALEGARKQASGAAGEARAREAGRMFENLLLRLVVGQLRKSMSSFGEESGMFGDAIPGHDIYGSLLDGALADAMSAGGGIGIGDVVAAGLRRRTAAPPPGHGGERTR